MPQNEVRLLVTNKMLLKFIDPNTTDIQRIIQVNVIIQPIGYLYNKGPIAGKPKYTSQMFEELIPTMSDKEQMPWQWYVNEYSITASV